MKKVAILGSTGSIGTQALDVIARYPDRFCVAGLAAGKQVERLREQARRFGAKTIADASDGPAGLLRVAVESEPDIVLAATDGFVAFEAVFAAVERGIDLAVANKELIVAAGELLTAAAATSGARIVPVDSEHSAVFQCLIGESLQSVDKIVLTASGGPFWRMSAQEMENADVAAALAHPTWRMGVKNTIDSATMMNKGLEVIEASRLFGMPGDRIEIVVHPQSIAHGMVVFTDGSVKMQCAAPDMHLPIGYALAYPERLPAPPEGVKPSHSAVQYDFAPPDRDRFPCIALAYEALRRGGTAPTVLSAANEIAVQAFVSGELPFGRIAGAIESVMEAAPADELTLPGIRRADARARAAAKQAVQRSGRRIEV